MAVLIPTFDPTTGVNIVPDLGSSDFITGYELKLTGALATSGVLTFQLQPGVARSYNNQFQITYPANTPFVSNPINVDASVIGPNGAYPYSCAVAANGVDTLFPVYVQEGQSGLISDGDTVGATASSANAIAVVATGNNFTLPTTLPAGNTSTVWRRAGSVYYNASGNYFYPMVQTGHHNIRNYMLATSVPIITNGVATTLTELQLNLGAFPIDPGVVTQVFLNVSSTPASLGDYAALTPINFVGVAGNYPVIVKSSVATVAGTENVVMPIGFDANGNPAIWYINSAAAGSTNVRLSGWTEDYSVNAV